MDKTDKLIRKALFDLLIEKTENKESTEEKPKNSKNSGVISTAGALGSGGRAKSFVASAKARASEDPEGLLADLGVKGSVGGSDLLAAQRIITTAIYSNPIMNSAYGGASLGKDTVPRLEGKPEKDVVAIQLGEIDRKNGIRFLAHTLVAAKNAGFLNLKGGLQFGQGQSNSIIIYSI